MNTTDTLNVARRELGTVESPPNSNNVKYAQWYGLNRNPWCAMFVSWVLDQTGNRSGYRHASVAASLAWARNNGRHTGEFRPGYVACRINSGGWTGPGHTGMVEAVHADGSVTCIEGNTSPGSSGSQRDGGGVWRRRRPRGFWNRQCIRIDFDNAGPAPGPPPPPPGTHVHNPRLAVDGDFGPSTIKALQHALGVAEDGDFGPNTKRAMQGRIGVAQDGAVGPQTIRALQRYVGVTQDGAWGPNTTRALQRKLNDGSF